eukprot:TRINITY_DN2364_c0_g1_i4.p1 TRINITY_DN2364_c0_g1~~TRINITY_DN2364_c0_g1_i4.p1  ORF type:complete len:899 (-),score=176.81 TRINITY_DN2364_c0_g1_i4:681-3377(-)
MDDNLNIIITKQLHNPTQKYKRIGIIGCVILICKLGSIERYEAKKKPSSSSSSSSQQNDSDCKRAFEMIDQLFECCSKDYDLLRFMYDELGSAFHSGDVRIPIAEKVSELVQESLKCNFILGTEACKLQNAIRYPIISKDSQTVHDFAINFRDNLVKVKESPLKYLPSEFRLLQTLIRYTHNNGMSEIDALIGSPYYTYEPLTLSEYAELTNAEREDVINILFHSINWTRELVNAFATQRDPSLTLQVVKRVQTMIELSDELNTFLSKTPSFHEAKTKKPTKSKDHDDIPLKLQLKYLDQVEKNLRQLEPSALNIFDFRVNINEMDPLSSEVMKLEPITLFHLLIHFHKILTVMLPPKRVIINPSATAPTLPYWAVVYSDLKIFLHPIRFVFGSLCVHLKRLCSQLSNVEPEVGDLTEEEHDKEIRNHIAIPVSVKLILKCLKILFSYATLYTIEYRDLMKEIVGWMVGMDPKQSLSQSLESLLEKAFLFFETYYQVIEELDLSVSLLELLEILSKRLEKQHLSKKLAKLSESNLNKKPKSNTTNTHKSEMIHFLLETTIKNSDDPVSVIKKFTEDIISPFDSSEKENTDDENALSDISKNHPLLSTSTFQIFYKVLFEQLCENMNSLKLHKKKSSTDEEDNKIMLIMHESCSIFNVLVGISKKTGDNKSILGNTVRCGKTFTETFAKYIVWLSSKFGDYRSQCIELFKNLQKGTRQLQYICAHSKVEHNISLVNNVPKLKKAVETFMYSVKMLLLSNNCQQAFWVGNLKHKDIYGTIVSSQVAVESEEEDEDEDNEKDNMEVDDNNGESDKSDEEGDKETQKKKTTRKKKNEAASKKKKAKETSTKKNNDKKKRKNTSDSKKNKKKNNSSKKSKNDEVSEAESEEDEEASEIIEVHT